MDDAGFRAFRARLSGTTHVRECGAKRATYAVGSADQDERLLSMS